MDRYQGEEPGMYSGARHVREKGYGHEIYNFLPSKRDVFGFVQFADSMHIEKLGADEDAEYVEGVTVIWTAPKRSGGVYVVGWYRNATVYREQQDAPNDRRRVAPGRGKSSQKLCWWSIRAAGKDVTFLDERNRWFKINPRLRSQSLFRYLDGGSRDESRLRGQLLDLVDGRLPYPRATPLKRRRPDSARLIAIEKAAVAEVLQYFGDQYDVRSVERDHVGWDLEARNADETILIEVKGCGGSEVFAELTPNEYSQSEKHRTSYMICIVTDALVKPKLHIFKWRNPRAGWCDQYDRTLSFEPRTAAVLRLVGTRRTLGNQR